jgi:DNA-binding NtrC family response regulator
MIRKVAVVVGVVAILALFGTACDKLNFMGKLEETVDEVKYQAQMGETALEISDAFTGVADQYNDPNLTDAERSDWMNQYWEENSGELQNMLEEAKAIEPPASQEENHAKFEEALAHFENVNAYMEAGVNESNMAQVQAEIEAGKQALEEFGEELDEPWLEDLKAKWQAQVPSTT